MSARYPVDADDVPAGSCGVCGVPLSGAAASMTCPRCVSRIGKAVADRRDRSVGRPGDGDRP
jgi:hypothetical protein